MSARRYTEEQTLERVDRLSERDAKSILLAMATELFGDFDEDEATYYAPDRTIDHADHVAAADILTETLFGEERP